MAETIVRRDWLKLVAGAATGVLFVRGATGCAYYAAESGDAYAPWNFPGAETKPERIAARAGVLASSPHNTQPWAFVVDPAGIEVHADLTRDLGVCDSLLRELYIGLGCAVENIAIAARASGRAAVVELFPDASRPSFVASIALSAAPPVAHPLFGAIASRHTNRGRYADTPAAGMLSSALQALVTEPGVALQLLTSRADMAAFRAGTIDATIAFIADDAMSRASNVWYRHTAAEILEHRDGITLDASGNGAATRFFGKSGGHPSDETADSYWLAGTREDQTTGSAFAILSSPGASTRADQLRVGRVFQRLHLWATSQGLAMQPLNQMTELQDREETQGLAPTFTNALGALLGAPGRRAQMLFRIGYPWNAALQSPRRPLEWVRQ